MRSLIITAASFVLTGFVVGNAYYQKKQFYPSVVYITKSNPSMAVLYIQAFVFVILMGKLMRKIFFGQLRAAEMEHLIERSWYAVTETCLAFTVFRDDFSPRFVAMFTLLLFLKCFHWLAEDRVDYMERSPVISFLFHCRVMSLLSFLGLLDIYFINHAYYSTLLKGASVQLVFGFEYAILLTVVVMTFMKYVLHTLDLQSENPWENKAVYLLYTELVMGFIRVMLYIIFMAIMIKVHTFPLFAIRPMYLSLRSFKKALHDVIMSRRAIRNMNTLYPDATAEELAAGDNVCIICREEMTTSCKKLPCNHIFHTNCLRSWFQRQQTCPTCRMDVLRMPRAQTTPAARPAQPPPDINMQNFQAMFQGMPFAWPPPQQPPAQQPPAHQPPGAPPASGVRPAASVAPPGTATTAPTSMPTSPGVSAAPGVVPPYGSFFPMMPYCPPFSFPRAPANMTGLSTEELQAMEGHERENVEARIQWLRDIQALLDGAMVLISQYNQVAAQMSMSGISTTRQSSSTTTSVSTSATASKTSSAGARPKTTVKSENSIPKSEVSKVKKEEKLDYSGLQGAMGYSPSTDELIPKWEDPNQEEHEDELHEVRKRRLKKFSQTDVSKEHNSSDNLDLD